MNFTHAFKFISTLTKECYIHPKNVEKQMRNCVIQTFQYQNKLWSQIVLDRLLHKNTGTNEIQKLAISQLKRTKDLSLFKNVICENLNLLRNSAAKEEKAAKSSMIKSKIELKKLISIDTLAGNIFTNYVDQEWNKQWKYNENSCQNKVKWLVEKQENKIKTIKMSKTTKN